MEKRRLIGKGRTAEIFALGEGKILKLFYSWCPAEWARKETDTTRFALEKGLPVPEVYGVVESEGRTGIVLERIVGPSMLSLIKSRPWLATSFGRTLARFQHKLHTVQAPNMPSLKKYMEKSITNAIGLPKESKEAGLAALSRLPEGHVLCHYDFHPDNIIMSKRGPIVIDWSSGLSGHPSADVARTLMLIEVGQPPKKDFAFSLVNRLRQVFKRAYQNEYLKLSKVTMEQIEGWRLPVLCARFAEGIDDEKVALSNMISQFLRK